MSFKFKVETASAELYLPTHASDLGSTLASVLAPWPFWLKPFWLKGLTHCANRVPLAFLALALDPWDGIGAPFAGKRSLPMAHVRWNASISAAPRNNKRERGVTSSSFGLYGWRISVLNAARTGR